MLITTEKAKRTLSWLFEKPLANTIPSLYVLDRAIITLLKTIFILIRILSKITFRKNKMTYFQFQRKCHINTDVNFSFYLFMFFYKLISILKLGNPSLIKIYVPKYNYKVYCPATVDDFVNMTTREQDILEHFNPKKNDTVVDIGAHLGRYALISSHLVGKEGKVITIEANPLVFEKLKKNLELNKVTNTICLNYAVYSEKTKIKLFVRKEESTNTEYSLRNTVMIDRGKLMAKGSNDAERVLEVNADTLDNLLDLNDIKQESVNWIKIDVEGAELEVLKGATGVLSKSKDISLLIEIHNLGDGQTLYQPIMDLLNNYNFKKEFEVIHEGGERHIVVHKTQL
jgi:FkbM family methyltransferase